MYLHTTNLYKKLKYSSYFFQDCFHELLCQPRNVYEFMDNILFDDEPHSEGSTHFTVDELIEINRINTLIRIDNYIFDSTNVMTRCLFYKLKSIIYHEILHITRDQEFTEKQLLYAGVKVDWFRLRNETEKMFINTDLMKLVLSYSDYCKRNAFKELLDFDENILKYFVDYIPIVCILSVGTIIEISIDEFNLIIQTHMKCQSGDYSAICDPNNLELRNIIEKLKNLLKDHVAEIEEDLVGFNVIALNA